MELSKKSFVFFFFVRAELVATGTQKAINADLHLTLSSPKYIKLYLSSHVANT